ncbi:MAG TPA: EAL domain-containing protein [Pseudonocardiaceae bacterium]|nr:EAL domain-containing protein [Pseudonocardiaceae bacterium]
MPHDRSALVAAWLRALAPTGFTPLPLPEFEHLVETHVHAMAAGLAADPMSTLAARRTGAALIDASFTDAESLRATLCVLGTGLLDLAEADGRPDPAARAFEMLAAVGAGYTARLRDWLFDQQEEVKQALQRANVEAARRLKRTEAWFREVFVRAAVGIAISDVDGRLAQANPALADILGCQPEELVGRSIEEFFHSQEAADLRADYHDLGTVGSKPLRRRRRLVRTDGQLVWVYLAVSVLRDSDDVPTLHLTMVENVSDLHLLQDLTSYQALHDVLTGLPNRQYLLSQLQSQLAEQPAGPAAGDHVTLYHLDLDGFAAINHGLGPDHGDRLLQVVARRLENQFAGQRALVARLTGDEFAVLYSAGSDPSGVLATVAEINEQLFEPVHIGGGGVGLSASIGVAHGVVGEIDPFELLRRADVSLRRAQATGKRQWFQFDHHRDDFDRRRATLAATLSGALEFGELTTLWQPWHSLVDGAFVGVSVRATWDHPEHGRIGHAECLALAEMTGAAVPLAAWLVDATCQQAGEWFDRFGDATPPIGVGLTVSQVADPDLVGTIRTAIEKADIRPNLLCLGIPTAALATEDGDTRDNLGVLTSMGVLVLLGEAGVGPLELALLDEWPLTAVQFAEPLVRSVAGVDPESRLVRTTGAMVRTLGDTALAVAVPGLCSAAEIEWWRSVGARAGCGPYYGHPVPAAELTVKLADRPARGRP